MKHDCLRSPACKLSAVFEVEWTDTGQIYKRYTCRKDVLDIIETALELSLGDVTVRRLT